MIYWVYQFLRGYLQVSLYGNNVKRLMNLCVQNNISLWNIQCRSDKEYGCTLFWKDIYRLVPHLRKTKTRFKIDKKIGLPYLKIKYKKRYFLFLSVGFVLLTLYILSGRIWKIEILGNSYLSKNEMLDFLKENHVYYNSKKKELDCDKLELLLRQKLEPVIWSSVYMEGTKLVVEIQERIKTEQIHTNIETPYNIVAKKDGIIASIVTQAGVPKVVKGQSVKCGDILVDASYPIRNDDDTVQQYIPVHSKATIKGYVVYQYEDTLPISSTEKQITKKHYDRFVIRIGNLSIRSIHFGHKYDYFIESCSTKQIRLFDDFYLPIYLTKERTFQQEEYTQNYTKEMAKELLSQKFSLFLKKMEENGVLIISKNVIMEKKGEIYYMHGTIQTCEDIGKKVRVSDFSKNGAQEE